MTLQWNLDPLWMRATHGSGVLAGAPPSYFGVTADGAQILDALESGSPLPPGHEPLTDRLRDAGAIHPIPHGSARVSDITVVVPCHAAVAEDVARVTRLAQNLAPLPVIVVDDGSPISFGAAPSDARIKVITLKNNVGPGAARNAAMSMVTSPVVCFVDDDVDISAESIMLLTSLVIDGHCDAAAPRVVSDPDASVIGQYEIAHSPLDMGDKPAVVNSAGRVPFVPSAVLACRVEALLSVGGFNESMRTGEDVDLVWRLVDSGYVCRYAPSIVTHHQPRRTMQAFAAQRFHYGASAARLDESHARAVTPLRAHFVVTLPGLFLLSGRPLIAVPCALLAVAWLAFGLRAVPLGFIATWRLAFMSIGHATRILAVALRRTWWPLTFGLACVFRPALVALVASVLVPAAWDIARNKPRRIFPHLGLRVLDDISYGAGVWRGAIAARSAGCLLPVITVWRSGAR